MEPSTPVSRFDLGDPVLSLAAFTTDDGIAVIAAACASGMIRLLDASTGTSRGTLNGHNGPATVVRSNGRSRLVSAGDDQDVHVWDPTTPSSLGRTRTNDAIRDLVLVGDLPTSGFMVQFESGLLLFHELPEASAISYPVSAMTTTDTGYALAHVGGLTVVANGSARLLGASAGIRLIAAAGDNLVTCGADDTMVLRDLASGNVLRRLQGHRNEVTALEPILLANGKHLIASASDGGTIRLWEPDTGEQTRFFLPTGRIRAMTHFVGADGGPRIVSAGNRGIIEVWDPQYPPSTRLGPVLTRGFGDRTATVDLLGREAFVSTTAELLRPASTTDADVGPNVLTVEGPWGSGKSTLLELVKARLTTTIPTKPGKRLRVWQADRLLRRPTTSISPEIPLTASVVATFNPWRHQSSEQVWAGLAKCVTKAVEDAILPDRDSRERHWFTRNTTRVDRRHTQRELWKRIRSPFLTLGVLGLGLTIVAQLAKLPIPLPYLIAVPSAPLLLGLLHTAKRYFYDRASAFLPGELFAGPISLATASTQPVADPYYNAKSGYLYLVQHDVTELLHDLEQRGLQLVVFVDDLDRCTPKTTAEVFEAINVFLSDTLPRTRFVLGLDPVVVASHVDHAYKELADAKVVAHPDDPSPGWTFLRKLVQLPIRLPRTTADNVTRVLEEHLGPVHRPKVTATAEPAVAAATVVPATISAAPEPALPLPVVEAVVIAIERHPDVRAYLHRRLTAQPEQSIREEKRLLTVWQFYLRVLPSTDTQRACHLVTIAELVTRWPAYQHILRKHLTTFATAKDDDLAWGTALAKASFKNDTAATNLRALLNDCDAQAVAALAERLL